jgi:hypothetical protein
MAPSKAPALGSEFDDGSGLGGSIGGAPPLGDLGSSALDTKSATPPAGNAVKGGKPKAAPQNKK